MAFGSEASNPARFGQGQTVNDRELFLDVFGGEVITAFDLATTVLDKHQVKTVRGARSWRFPKTWKATAEYHQPGQEMLGNDIDTSEITVTVDDVLVSHTAIADIDKMLSHFDVRAEFSKQMGRALARVYDKNVYRQLVLASRAAADGPFPGGTVVDADELKADANGKYNGLKWIETIREANLQLFDKDVPEDLPRYLTVGARVFDAIKYATDANGQYLVINRDFGHSGAGGLQGRAETITIDGVTIIKSRNTPFGTDESADTSVYSKYRADYAATVGVMWCPMAVATVQVAGVGFETERTARRQEDFLVAKMLVGHGTLRPECAVEFKDTSLNPGPG